MKNAMEDFIFMANTDLIVLFSANTNLVVLFSNSRVVI